MSDVLRLQAFLRATAAPGRRVLELPPFTAYLDRDDPMRFLNYAIPEDGAEPDAAAVEGLRAGFREHGRLPRLECVQSRRRVSGVVSEGVGRQTRWEVVAHASTVRSRAGIALAHRCVFDACPGVARRRRRSRG